MPPAITPMLSYEDVGGAADWLVRVFGLDAHFERARAGGARIFSEVEDTPFGDRHYRVEDLEGHRWMFAQHEA